MTRSRQQLVHDINKALDDLDAATHSFMLKDDADFERLDRITEACDTFTSAVYELKKMGGSND